MAWDKLTISSDSHILEVPEIFDGLSTRFGDDAPGIVYDPARGDVLRLGKNVSRSVVVGRFGIAGHYANDRETQEMMRQGYSAMRPGALDPVERIKDQEIDGVDAEVLLPSVLLALNTLKDGEIIAATFKNYNDWVRNYADQAPGRLFPTACLPMHDLDLAIEELKRTAAVGHVAANIPCVAPADRLYSDPWYDRFWATAQEMGTPLIMHTITSTQPNHGLPDMGPVMNYAFIAFAMQRTIGDLICSGVCARYPDLQFVPTEWETGWIPYFLERMNWSVIRAGMAAMPAEFTERFQLLLPPELPRHLRGRPDRPPDARPHRRQEPDVGLRLPAPRLDVPALARRPGRDLRGRPKRRAVHDHGGQLPRPLPPAVRGPVLGSRSRKEAAFREHF